MHEFAKQKIMNDVIFSYKISNASAVELYW